MTKLRVLRKFRSRMQNLAFLTHYIEAIVFCELLAAEREFLPKPALSPPYLLAITSL